jgi:hypothetical protein
MSRARMFTDGDGSQWTVDGVLLHQAIEDVWLLTFSSAMGRRLYLRVESDAWMRMPEQWLRGLRAQARRRRSAHAPVPMLRAEK